MVDKIVELNDSSKYLILKDILYDGDKYYYGVKLDSKNQPGNKYLFFHELNNNKDIFLIPIEDKDKNNLVMTLFTINRVNNINGGNNGKCK